MSSGEVLDKEKITDSLPHSSAGQPGSITSVVALSEESIC